jgi:uncharacterized membrane protein
MITQVFIFALILADASAISDKGKKNHKVMVCILFRKQFWSVWEKIVLMIANSFLQMWGIRLGIWILSYITGTIYSNSERSDNLLKQNAFYLVPGGFSDLTD